MEERDEGLRSRSLFRSCPKSHTKALNGTEQTLHSRSDRLDTFDYYSSFRVENKPAHEGRHQKTLNFKYLL
ncbi:Uncharacterized protein DAT39_013657 [Clarias magur]|uniref:Uncharacterized protein n=1 Tax=Clarias magur TaxID=1594786 RepID=A0A8J4TFK3_CLAMG|nr:Uncharacterized protein DAT39_013657 [Clarias magur]